jgi:EAL domain-containing protein (putative c-di-GMP-specific phosphodiesterase class I)
MFGKNGEMISPGEFIPIAEETNMIQDLSWIVVEKVCAFISTHPKLPIDCISVNFSEQQFLEDDVIERFNGLVNKYNIDPSMIRIEITESIITYHPETTREVMDKFIEQGVFFSMDDFGVKYSNFSNMLTLPFKAIKLDKTLVDKLFGTEREIQFIWSIIKMLIEAGYIVVAEGIEDPYTSKKLKSMGVHFIQGFFYSRPLPEKDFVNFLSNSGGK